jgi:acetyl-CoA decarbonylase/synthase complex subunit gamma
MALTGLEIFKQLPKTNCKECGFPTCLAFAMKVAAGQEGLDSCPSMTDEARSALSAASAPPQKLVKIVGLGCRAKRLRRYCQVRCRCQGR